jgi:hypothetical protein
MRFNDEGLSRVLETWASDSDKTSGACGQNLLLEERLEGPRWTAFEALAAAADSPDALRRAATKYYFQRVRIPSSETFSPLNRAADMGMPSGEQKIVRVELIGDLLDKTGVSYEVLEAALAKKNATSEALLNWVIDQWNDRPDIRRNPISFGAFKDQLLEELADPDWPHRLRDRLGLAHLDPIAGALPIALMEYRVDEVASGAPDHPVFTMPTALDCEPYAQFFPTPRELAFGSPMALYPVYDDAHLVAEVLHPRLRYSRANLARLGRIDVRAPNLEIAGLRENHVWALRLAAEREDFGVDI